jgi:hypothetical protein
MQMHEERVAMDQERAAMQDQIRLLENLASRKDQLSAD